MNRRGLITGAAALAAFAALPAHPALGALGRAPAPGWALPGAVFDFDFKNLRPYGAPVTWRSSGTITAGTSGVQQGNGIVASYLPGADGVFRLCAANSIKIADGVGLACFDGATFNCLQNRDATNGVWTKVGCTASRIIGADGVANSGSRLTATANNATCSQSITLASATHLLSVVIKRVAGSGAITLSLDGGATTTTIGPTSSYTQIAVPSQTLANPQVVIGMAASGDIIDVDFIDLETGGNNPPKVPGPPVAVTTAAVTRFREIPEINNGRGGGGYPNGATGDRWLNIINSGQAALYVEWMGTPRGATSQPTTTDGVQFTGAITVGAGLPAMGGTTSNPVLPGWNRVLSGFSGAPTAGGGSASGLVCLNGGTPLLTTGVNVGALSTTHMVLGGNGSGANAIDGYISRIALFEHVPPASLAIELTRLAA